MRSSAASDVYTRPLRIPADAPHRYLVPEQGYITYVLVRIPALLAGGVIPDDAPVLDLQPLGFVRWGADELARRDASLATRIRPDRSARETLAETKQRMGLNWREALS